MSVTYIDDIFNSKNRLLYTSKKNAIVCKYYVDKICLPAMFYLYANFNYCTLVIMIFTVTK